MLVVLLLCAGGIPACGGDKIAGLVQDPPQLYWALTLEQKAITLSLDRSQPEYYTLQLVATPRTIDGTPITTLGKPTFTVSDTNFVQVDSNGVLTARRITTTPIRIVASLSSPQDQVTNTDTAFVTVTQDPATIASFTIQPDSTTIGVGYDTRLTARIADGLGNPVEGVRVSYRSSDDAIASIDTGGVLLPKNKGTVTIVANTSSYGVERSDSVELTITDPIVFRVDVRQDLTPPNFFGFFDPAEVTIKAGQGIAWTDAEFAFVNVTFDDPTNVAPGPLGGAGGNIASFFQGRVVRMFPVPGVYSYHDTSRGITGFSGKIIVTP
jgi:plastocyanin